jgi:L-lactate dehydrogenase complex protein LldG
MTSSLPDSREKILRRIREALQLSAPPRHLGHGAPTPAPNNSLPGDRSEQWLPPVPENRAGQIALFAQLSAGLQTEFIELSDLAAARNWLSTRAQTEGWTRWATHYHPLLDELWQDLALPDSHHLLRTDGGYDKAALESCQVGVTGCDYLVAQTGTVVITPESAGGRVLSVLPPHHVIIARAEQVSRDLKEALQRLRQQHDGKMPRYISFITGPSRTGDIERILVLGAHGPRKLSILLLPE